MNSIKTFVNKALEELLTNFSVQKNGT